MPDLSVQLAGLTLRNPIVIGGGPITGTAEHIRACVDAGVGAIVTKTSNPVTYLQRFPRPLYQLVDYKLNPQNPAGVPEFYTWLHREHNSVFPPEAFAQIIHEASPYARQHRVPIIGNFTARGIDEWVQIAEIYVESGADALELNFCCPFPPKGVAKSEDDVKIGIYYTMHPDKAAEVVRAVAGAVDVPVFTKLNPDGTEFVKIAKLMQDAGADGVTMFANNSFLRIDIEKGKPFLYGPTAGTGPGILADSLRWVADVARHTEIPIMGGRGLNTWRDMVEFLMAGAGAVQVVQAVMVRGLGYVEELLDGLERFMVRRKYPTIAKFQGMALSHIYSNMDMIEKVKPLYADFDLRKCEGCHRCVEVCWYDAIKFALKALPVTENCVGCSLCSQVCPEHVITMRERLSDVEHFVAISAAHKDLMPKDLVLEGIGGLGKKN